MGFGNFEYSSREGTLRLARWTAMELWSGPMALNMKEAGAIVWLTETGD